MLVIVRGLVIFMDLSALGPAPATGPKSAAASARPGCEQVFSQLVLALPVGGVHCWLEFDS